MTAQLDRSFRLPLSLLGLAALGVLWSYWTTLAEIVWRWTHDPQYSHGYLVPGFALYLLWLRREPFLRAPLQPSAWGLALLSAAIVLRLVGTFFHLGYFDQMSLLPCLLGVFMLGGGWSALLWTWPAVAFLAFMIPLPHTWSLALSAPMQAFATLVSTFCLQVLGRPALAEGNLILLNEIELGIVEACSGLRMLVVFFALSTGVAILIRKPLWEKLVIASSAIPIALAANVLRITATGLFYDRFGANFGGAFFHDLAGWLMMPLGLACLGLELWILGHLLIEPSKKLLASQVSLQRVEVDPLSFYRSGTSRRARRAAAAAPTSATSPVAPS
jgi:exosortase